MESDLHREGLQAMEQGRYVEGIAKLEQASRDDPANVAYQIDLKSRRLAAVQQMLSAADMSRAAGRFDEAKATYGAFALGLRRHIGFEEQLLFPEYEKRSGFPADAGPTAMMRFEHREIESLLQAIEGAIGDPKANADALRADLHEVLAGHNVKEERILYPGADRLMSRDETDELVRRIQAYRR